MVKMITVWYKYNDEGSEAKLNHIEDGWVNEEYPRPIYIGLGYSSFTHPSSI